MKKLLILFPFLLFGNILSPLQQQLLNSDRNKAIVSGNKLKDSWINPLTLQYQYNQTNQISTNNLQKNNSFIISITQPIFKSGAIWASIKYADFLKSENIQKTELQKKLLIKQAYEILFNIKAINISIAKQKLLIANANIDIKRKKEQFLSGVLDSSFLDNALINKNNLELGLKDLISQKKELINSFNNLSNLNYKNIELPHFNIISEKDYLKNINIKIAKKDIEVKKYLKNMNIGNSLFSINFNANYNYINTKYDNQTLIYQNNKTHFYNVGISVVIPLSVNSMKNIEESKIDYLKSVLNYQNEILKSKNQYKTEINKINTIEQKIKIYKNSIKNYSSLIKSTKDNIEAGINTILDLETLENSQKIEKLNIQNLKIQKNIDLLNLYYVLNNNY